MVYAIVLQQLQTHLHASDGLLILVRRQVLKVIPPLKQHRLADELEPRREDERLLFEHGLELGWRHVLDVLGLVGVNIEVNGGLGEEDVVNCRSTVSPS